MKISTQSDFSLTIDFDKESENPSRVFESMANIIKSFEQLDKDLVKHLDNKIETVLLLEDVEVGSLKTILANIIKKIPDDAIKDLDAKKIIGAYLLKAKYIILNNLEGKTLLTDGEEIEIIEMELKKAAKNTGVDQMLTYVPTNKKTIIKNIDTIHKSLDPLTDKDKAFFEYQGTKANFNLMLKLDYESMESLITNEEYRSNSIMVLKIKKPDYLGDSKWSFKHGHKPLEAKILHSEWLFKFKNREVDVRPKDALVCEVTTIAKYDHDNNLISTEYEIVEVKSIRTFSNDPEIF